MQRTQSQADGCCRLLVVVDLRVGVEEGVLEIVEGIIVQVKLPLEGAIGHAAALAQQDDRLSTTATSPSWPLSTVHCAYVCRRDSLRER